MNAAPAPLQHYRHIVVEGPVGAGKTALATRLARALGAQTLLGQARSNPLLERFYDDPPGYAFQTQLFYLFERLRQVREIAQPGMFVPTVVSDFMFARDALFARVNLSDEEYPLYAQMYARLAPQLPQPDLVIWLQADAQTLLERIRRRAFTGEQRISLGYVQRLCDAYAEHFRHDDGAPVFAVDSERFQPASVDADFALLLERLQHFRARRGFLEPAEATARA